MATEEKVDKILDMIIAGAEKGSQFVGDQAPLLFEEYYRSELSEVIFEVTLGVFWFAFVCFFYRAFWSKWAKGACDESKSYSDRDWYGSLAIGSGIFGVVVSVLMGICFICSSQRLIKAIVAPKVFTIQTIRGDM